MRRTLLFLLACILGLLLVNCLVYFMGYQGTLKGSKPALMLLFLAFGSLAVFIIFLRVKHHQKTKQ